MKKNSKKKNTSNSEHWSHKHDYPIEEVWNTENTLARLIARASSRSGSWKSTDILTVLRIYASGTPPFRK